MMGETTEYRRLQFLDETWPQRPEELAVHYHKELQIATGSSTCTGIRLYQVVPGSAPAANLI